MRDGTLGAYLNNDEGDGSSIVCDDWAFRSARGECAGVFRGRQQALGDAGVYEGGFDFAAHFMAADYLRGFDIPGYVLRDDGFPMPFIPSDPVHTATFTSSLSTRL